MQGSGPVVFVVIVKCEAHTYHMQGAYDCLLNVVFWPESHHLSLNRPRIKSFELTRSVPWVTEWHASMQISHWTGVKNVFRVTGCWPHKRNILIPAGTWQVSFSWWSEWDSAALISTAGAAAAEQLLLLRNMQQFPLVTRKILEEWAGTAGNSLMQWQYLKFWICWRKIQINL